MLTFSALISCTLIFGTNYALKTFSSDQAFQNRLLLLPFSYPKEQQDRNLSESLIAERSGILFKALLAYKRLASNNYHFSGDDVFTAARQLQYAEASQNIEDSVEAFLRNCCTAEPGTATASADLFRAFEAFCREQGICQYITIQRFSHEFGQIAARLIQDVFNKKMRLNG